jgi:predicted aspartyl protease
MGSWRKNGLNLTRSNLRVALSAIIVASIPAAGACADGCGTRSLGKIVIATLNRAPFVTLLANGRPVTLILDTGAERTVLTPTAADRIAAQRPIVEFPRQLRGISGDLQSREIELRSFTAGSVALPWRRVLVAPVTMAQVFATPLDGLLGADVLSDFDIDLDLPHHELKFYEKQICPTASPDWREPYISLSTGLSRGQHLFFPVRLEDRSLTAFIDTGAQITTVSRAAAHAIGVTDSLLASDRPAKAQGIAAGPLPARIHQFAKLNVGPLVIARPEILVTDVSASDADVVLGIDFLFRRRVWLSYGARRVFLSSR